MALLIILQTALDLGFIALITYLLVERAKIKKQEDARLSRGLQLLANKAAAVQDLMDRSEVMGRQLGQLIDKKQAEVHEKLELVNSYLHKLQDSMDKSKDVARIFQDKIPHKEIIERQTSLKYVEAAKMAQQGIAVADIAKRLEIPMGELEILVKMSRGGLSPEPHAQNLEFKKFDAPLREEN